MTPGAGLDFHAENVQRSVVARVHALDAVGGGIRRGAVGNDIGRAAEGATHHVLDTGN